MDDLLEYLENALSMKDFKKLIIPIFFLILYLAGLLYLTILINKIKIPKSLYNEVIKKEETVNSEYIYIDVKGSVKNPGVYKLNSNSRVVDAIEASGGVLDSANTRFINLSKALNDGDVVVVYSNEEIENAKKEETIYVETPCVCEEVKNDACYKEDGKDDKININTANLNELKTLTGIGDAKANAIIEYRNKNGNFKSIEEIKNVSGISNNLYEQIKDFITI